jgi:hypothetical protein
MSANCLANPNSPENGVGDALADSIPAMSAELMQGRKPATLRAGGNGAAKDKLYAGQRMDDQHFAHRTFEHCTFANVSFFGATLDQCSFLNCAFVNCYFRRATIRQCDFTGAKFVYCSFPEHRLRIETCEFQYAEFRGCYLPFRRGQYNLPRRKHNLCDDLASALAREAEASGASNDARLYRRAAFRARERHHLAIVLARSEHYRTHRYIFADRVRSFGVLVRAKFNRRVWGYGESGLTLLVNYVVVGLVLFPGLFYLLRNQLSKPSGRTVSFGDTEFLSVQHLLNASSISPVSYTGSLTRTLGGLETVTGLLFIGLFIALLLRWTQRR